MKIVKITHELNEHAIRRDTYLFETPVDLPKGAIVLTNPKGKYQNIGIVLEDSIDVDENVLKYLEQNCGYKLPLAKVIGIYWMLGFKEQKNEI